MMRKQYLYWMIAVFGIVATAYGGFTLAYNLNHGKGLSGPALVLLILGVITLAFLLGLALYALITKRKAPESAVDPEPIEEAKSDETVKEVKPEPDPSNVQEETIESEEENGPETEDDTEQEETSNFDVRPNAHESSFSSRSYSTIYVKEVGHGPVLRFEGDRILDMRESTYYRIEGDFVMQEGYGVRYEIRGNGIRDAFGGFLYELSGDHINKVFGGYYASISGNYITIHDLSKKFEMTDRLSKKQLLVLSVLLFGRY